MSIFNIKNTARSLPGLAKNTIKALALVLAVSGLPMTSPAKADNQNFLNEVFTAPNGKKVSKKKALRNYANSAYGYCDAKKISAVWNNDIGRAKIVIGRKIASGLTHLIDQDIASTANSVPCSYQESGFGYDDAVRLSQLWNIGIGQAKDKIQYNTSRMGTKKFRIYAGL